MPDEIADEIDSNDTQSKINREDRELAQKHQDGSAVDRDNFQRGSAGDPGANPPEGEFAEQGQAATGDVTTGGIGGQAAGSVGTIGGSNSETANSDSDKESDS